jgi:hypothetical protein
MTIVPAGGAPMTSARCRAENPAGMKFCGQWVTACHLY